MDDAGVVDEGIRIDLRYRSYIRIPKTKLVELHSP